MPTCLSQSERLNLIMKQQTNYVSRSNVRDSSEFTAIQKARASSVKIPSIVSYTSVSRNSTGSLCAASYVVKGKGTNMDHDSITEYATSCATCSDVRPSVVPGIIIPSLPCDHTQQPFAQRDSGSVGGSLQPYTNNVYNAPCKPPEQTVNFPPFLERGDTSDLTCKYPHLPMPSG